MNRGLRSAIEIERKKKRKRLQSGHCVCVCAHPGQMSLRTMLRLLSMICAFRPIKAGIGMEMDSLGQQTPRMSLHASHTVPSFSHANTNAWMASSRKLNQGQKECGGSLCLMRKKDIDTAVFDYPMGLKSCEFLSSISAIPDNLFVDNCCSDNIADCESDYPTCDFGAAGALVESNFISQNLQNNQLKTNSNEEVRFWLRPAHDADECPTSHVPNVLLGADKVSGTASFDKGSKCTTHNTIFVGPGESLHVNATSSKERAVIAGALVERKILFYVRGELTLSHIEITRAGNGVVLDSQTFLEINCETGYDEDPAKLFVIGSAFIGNKCNTGDAARTYKYGSGIRAFGGEIVMEGSVLFEDNVAIKGGGAYFEAGAQVKITGSETKVRFTGNGEAIVIYDTGEVQSTYAGALGLQYEAVMLVKGGAMLEIDGNFASVGGGVMIMNTQSLARTGELKLTVDPRRRNDVETSLHISGSGSKMVLSNNEACFFGGLGVFRLTNPDGDNKEFEVPSLKIDKGALLQVIGNKALCDSAAKERLGVEGTSAGIGAKDGNIEIADPYTKVQIVDNLSEDMGGGLSIYRENGYEPPMLNVSNGAVLEFEGNTARIGGALGVLSGNVYANGLGTLIRIIGNQASQYGAGIFIQEGSKMTVNDGARLQILKNRAGLSGAGMYASGANLVFEGNVERNSDYTLDVSNNSLTSTIQTFGGAGFSIGSKTNLRIHARSQFYGNNAGPSDGGAIAAFSTSTETGRLGECVDVVLETLFSTCPNCREDHTPFSLSLKTMPQLLAINYGPDEFTSAFGPQSKSKSDLFVEDKVEVSIVGDSSDGFWSTREECLPCGEYVLSIRASEAEKMDQVKFAGTNIDPFIEVRLAQGDPGSKYPDTEPPAKSFVLLDRRDTKPMLFSRISEVIFEVPCIQQGISIEHASFEENVANGGGAIAVNGRTNLAISIGNSRFLCIPSLDVSIE